MELIMIKWDVPFMDDLPIYNYLPIKGLNNVLFFFKISYTHLGCAKCKIHWKPGYDGECIVELESWKHFSAFFSSCHT